MTIEYLYQEPPIEGSRAKKVFSLLNKKPNTKLLEIVT
jgi:hypothetical protein